MRPDRSKDRPVLKNLLAALDVQTRVLQRDNCGDWQIRGKHGEELEDTPSCIYAVPEEGAFYLYVATRSRWAWTSAKRRLSFCVVTQDGDEKGVLRLDRLPSPEEATAIRKVLAIPRKRHLSPEVRAALVGRLHRKAA